MQTVAYKCDTCLETIGDIPHVSLNLSSFSGIASPPTKSRELWRIEPSISGLFLHFCSVDDMAIYFHDLMAKATKKPNIKTKKSV